jgi:hypothetical protein
MARIPFVEPDDPDIDPEAARLLAQQRERHGRNINVQKALANHPELMRKLFDWADTTYFSNSVDPVSRELAYYTAAVTNDCHY